MPQLAKIPTPPPVLSLVLLLVLVLVLPFPLIPLTRTSVLFYTLHMPPTPTSRTRYIEIDVQSALNRMDGAATPGGGWSLNPYRGCRHDCVYCYARYTHTYLELNPTTDFARTVFVKRNLAAALAADLRRPGWDRARVHIGAATDPYQPAEGHYRLTQAALRLLRQQLTPATVVTKNTLALRDADLMASLARAAGFRLIMSITTVNEQLARQLEPDVPSPQQRLRAVQALAAAGVPVSVAAAPILPGLTDSAEALTALFTAAYDHGADIAFHQTLRLYGPTRGAFFTYLQQQHPELIGRYRLAFGGGQDAPAAYRHALQARIAEIRAHLAPGRPHHARPPRQEGQLALGL